LSTLLTVLRSEGTFQEVNTVDSTARPRRDLEEEMERRTIWTLMALTTLTGCPMGSDDPTDSGDTATTDHTDTDPQTDTGSAPSRSLEGMATRSVVPSGDGIGTLYVGALDGCDLTANFVGIAVVSSADLSADGAEVPFSMEGLPSIEVHLATFLDDNLDADPKLPLPGPSDLVYGTVAQDGALDCLAVDLASGDASGVVVDLGLLVPDATR